MKFLRKNAFNPNLDFDEKNACFLMPNLQKSILMSKQIMPAKTISSEPEEESLEKIIQVLCEKKIIR